MVRDARSAYLEDYQSSSHGSTLVTLQQQAGAELALAQVELECIFEVEIHFRVEVVVEATLQLRL